MEKSPSLKQEQEPTKIKRDELVTRMRALHERGVSSMLDETNDPETLEVQGLMEKWNEQQTAEAASSGNPEDEIRAAVSWAILDIDAGFTDQIELEDRREWLIQDHDEAVAAGLPDLAQEVLQHIHRVDDLLGQEHFNPQSED